MTQTLDPSTDASTANTGSLTVITGSMFSGKTEELIRLVRRALYARRRIQVFKHALVLCHTFTDG
jgi:thymidine kinase